MDKKYSLTYTTGTIHYNNKKMELEDWFDLKELADKRIKELVLSKPTEEKDGK